MSHKKPIQSPNSASAILFKAGMVIGFLFFCLLTPEAAARNIDASSHVEFQEGKILLRARETPLHKILQDIDNEFKVAIRGLEDRATETITFYSRGDTLQDILSALLRHLGEKNYAFEYHNETLKRVLVLPKAKAEMPAFSAQPSQGPKRNETIKAVEVLGIVDQSQAEELGLVKGDLILEYDGVKIDRASELVKKTKKRSPEEQIEIIVMRDGDPLRFFVNGGFIGIRIKTINILKEALHNYYR